MKNYSIKRALLSLVLCVALLSGCGNSLKTVEKEPYLVVKNAYKQTLDTITSDFKGFSNSFNPDGSGKASFSLSSNLFSYDVSANTDSELNSSGNFSVEVLGKTVGTNIYRKGTQLAFQSNEILGNDAIGIDFATAKEDIKTATLFSMSDMNYNDLPADEKAQIEYIFDMYNKMLSNNPNELKGIGEKYSEELNTVIGNIFNGVTPSVEESEVEYNGKSEKVFVVSYSLTKEQIQALAKGYLETYKKIFSDPAFTNYFSFPNIDGTNLNSFEEFNKEFDTIIEEIDKANITADVKFTINKKTKDFVSFDCALTELDQKLILKLDLGLTPKTSSQYVFSISTEENGTTKEVFNITWKKTEGATIIDGILTIKGEDIEPIDIKITYDPKAYNYSIEGSTSVFPDRKITLTGVLSFDEKGMTFTIDKIGGIEDLTKSVGLTNIKFSYKYSKDYTVEPMPEYKNLLKMTKEEIMELYTNIINFSTVTM